MPPRPRAQRSARIASARLSGPPETPIASRGRGSKPPIAVSAASSSIRVSGLAAANALLLGGGALPHRRSRIGEGLVELVQGQARILLLVGARQRHAEIEQAVRRFRPFRKTLVALRKGGGGLG